MPESPRRRSLRVPRARVLAKFLMLAPALAIFAFFFLAPLVYGLVLSLFHWGGLEPARYVGFDNYKRLLSDDPVFLTNLRVTVTAAAVVLVTVLPAAVLLAVCLSGRGRLMPVFRWLLFLPVVMPLAATGLLWTEIFNPVGGLANEVIGLFGIEPVAWLGSKGTALWALIIVTIWSSLGLHVVIQLSTLSSIPTSLKEAARLETSSSWRVFRHVVLPLMRDGLTVSAVLIVTGTFVIFTSLAAIMTRGGPSHATEVLGLRMYQEAFTSFNFGYASAITVIAMLLTITLVGLIMLIGFRKRVEY